MFWWHWRSWRRAWPFDRRRRVNPSAVALTFLRRLCAVSTHCFDDRAPATSRLESRREAPWVTVYVMDMAGRDMTGLALRIRDAGVFGPITAQFVKRAETDHDDGA